MKRAFMWLAIAGLVLATSTAFAGVGVIINELDADTTGTDTLEFLELYDGGAGNTPLDGLVVVLFNGNGDTSYNAFDLDGFSTDANGYFLMGNALVVPTPALIFSDNGLQNGADAAALYVGSDSDFPNGTAVTTANLLDAMVYDTNDSDDAGLLVLLNPAEPQVNEDGGGDKDVHSSQRSPNGSGGARNTSTYVQALPTPGGENVGSGGGSVIINEVDADTVGSDALEFVELFDGGAGGTSLDGLVLVLFNGSSDTSYNAFDLDGFSTDVAGYFLLGNPDVVPLPDIQFPGNGLQNGADAVALYMGDDTDFPTGTPVTTTGLVDAMVYDTNDADDAGLLVLLNAAQPQVNEDDQGNKDFHSNQRCANGSGGERNTDTYVQATPTPGAANGGPDITTQPVDVGTCEGGAAVFSVVANGTSYQWRKDGLDLADGGSISGATTDTLTIDPVVAGDSGNYDCVVSNGCADVFSDIAVLTAAGSTTILTQPNDTTTFVGATAVLMCEGSGAPPVTYQWRKEGIDLIDGGRISGATTTCLQISPIELGDAGNYDCIVTSGCGTTPSDIAVLTVIEIIPEVLINELRIDQGGTDFDEYFELVGAPGTPLDGLTYVVIGDTGAEQGIVEAVIPLTGSVIPADGHFLAVEDTFGAACGDAPDLVLSSVDNEINFENSDNVTHLLVAGWSGLDGDDLDVDDDCILDATPWFSVLDDLSLKETDPPDCMYSTTIIGPDGNFVPATVYRCPNETGSFLIGAFSVCDGAETPGFPNPPCVVIDPTDVDACEGEAVGFSITALGSGTLTYQWRQDGGDLVDDGRISGATTDTLAIDPVFATDAGAITCVVTDDNDSSESGAAALTVAPLYDVRVGNVNGAVGPVTDVLFVNGGVGSDPQREIDIDPNVDDFVLTVDAPPSRTKAKYAIYIWFDTPTKDTVETLPDGTGDIGMPTPLTGNVPQPAWIANNLKPSLGTTNWFPRYSPIDKAPFTLIDEQAPLPRENRVFYIQGIIQDDDAPNGKASVTNGILVNLGPLNP